MFQALPQELDDRLPRTIRDLRPFTRPQEAVADAGIHGVAVGLVVRPDRRVPPRRDSRSGAIATKPSLASCSVVWRMKSDIPKISWITTTAGAGSLRSG